MSTTKQPLKYLWVATFTDGHVIEQPANDHYSKHDENAEWNPSSFRDILEYDGTLESFSLKNDNTNIVLPLDKDDKLIYFRTVDQLYIDGVAQEPYIVNYNIGYEHKNKNGKNIKKVITIDG